jgi:Tfp pilus assembly protein PilX
MSQTHLLHLASVKRRARRRSRSRGAVIFIVAMTIAVLATIGLYGLTSAATEARSAAYERQAAQTHYLSQYGLEAVTQSVFPTTAGANLPGNALIRDSAISQILCVPNSGKNCVQAHQPWNVCPNAGCQMCMSIASVPKPTSASTQTQRYAGCYKVTSGQLASAAGQNYWPPNTVVARTPDVSNTAGPIGGYLNIGDNSAPYGAGSSTPLGPNGGFVAEFTDVLESGNTTAGTNSNGSACQANYIITVTVYGTTTPMTGDLSTQGLELGRGHITVSGSCQ